MSEFKRDFEWQSQFLPEIRRVVGPLLLEPAPLDLDMKEATDLLVLRARDMRIGCRMRRVGYAERYGYEFTIRARRDSGAETELSKITEGWGDWLFYGHAGNQWGEIARWMLVDLHAWRAHMIRSGRKAGNPQNMPNGDGTYFKAFDVRRFPERPPILVSCSFAPAVTELSA